MAMQVAIGFAQVALYCVVFIPYLSDTILELQGIDVGWEGWVAAFIGALSTLVLCELYKLVSKGQIAAMDRKQAEEFQKNEA